MAPQKGEEGAYGYAYTYRPQRHTTGAFSRLLRNDGRATPAEPPALQGVSAMRPAGVEAPRNGKPSHSEW
jgi:hypothetical protein